MFTFFFLNIPCPYFGASVLKVFTLLNPSFCYDWVKGEVDEVDENDEVDEDEEFDEDDEDEAKLRFVLLLNYCFGLLKT